MLNWNNDDATIWLNPRDAAIISLLPKFIDFEIKSLLEIGVFRGGLIRTFLQNNLEWKAYGIDPYPGMDHEKTRCFEILSAASVSSRFELLKDWEVFLSKRKKSGLIHIDGEHTERAVLNDLMNTVEVASSSPIIIVDDFFARSFPGVTCAVFRFIFKFDFEALLVSPAKIYLCRSEWHDEYKEKFRQLLSELDLKYSDSFPRGLYGLDYDQPSTIKGRLVFIVENQAYTENFIKTLGISYRPNTSREVLIKIFSQITPPFLYARLRRWFKFVN